MKAKMLYMADDTTTTLHLEGHKITTQVYGDGRGKITILDESGNVERVVTVSRVVLIDLTI